MKEKNFIEKRKWLLVGLVVVALPFLLNLFAGDLGPAFQSMVNLLITLVMGIIFFGPFVLLFRWIKGRGKKKN